MAIIASKSNSHQIDSKPLSGSIRGESVHSVALTPSSVQTIINAQGIGITRIYESNGSELFEAISGEPSISALRCIVMRGGAGFVASSDDVTCANAIAGISTIAAASLGASFIVQGSGIIEDSSFNWQDNLPIFCGPDGRLTQTPPTSGFSQQVAIPLASNKLEISLQQTIIL